MDKVLEDLLLNYGYLAVLIGTFLEGETILVLGGLAAHEGYLSLPMVMLCAFCGSLTGDQLYFFIGRHFGGKLLKRSATWERRVARASKLTARFHSLFILSFRFLYGIRTVAPFSIGMSKVSTKRFVLLNIIGAFIWAIAVALLGYAFGGVLSLFLAKVKRYEKWVFGSLVALGMLLWLFFKLRDRARDKAELASGEITPPEE